MRKLLLFLILFIVPVLASAAGDEYGESQLVTGKWTHRGLRTILGEGADTTISLSQTNGRWYITFCRTHYPSINAKDRTPISTTEGPYPVTVKDGVLAFQKDGRQVRNTYKIDKQVFAIPAIIRQSPGLWVYLSPGDSLTIKCNNDPFTVPVGRATFPGVVNNNGYYVYEEAPRSRFWPSAQYLRFLVRTDDGQLIERFRLIFDEYGTPRYERILSTGERSHNEYPATYYQAEPNK